MARDQKRGSPQAGQFGLQPANGAKAVLGGSDMLNRTQRWIVFFLFCIFSTVCIGGEVYLVYSLVHGEITNIKAISAFLNTTVLVLIGRKFGEMISKTFLQSSIIPPERLHRFASERCSIIQNAISSRQDAYLTRQNLITNTLKFSEESLRGWVPGSHFELCVFIDQKEPLLFAYFDSNHDTTARSMGERERNPHFYVEKGYEVTRLLQTPTSYPRVLKDTHDPKANYVFTSNDQRKQLGSTVLICLDVTTPCALVVTSNQKNAFPETDPEVMSFIKYIGESVRYDLIEEDFVRRIRDLKPSLFAKQLHTN
jgi:hypothetical protein